MSTNNPNDNWTPLRVAEGSSTVTWVSTGGAGGNYTSGTGGGGYVGAMPSFSGGATIISSPTHSAPAAYLRKHPDNSEAIVLLDQDTVSTEDLDSKITYRLYMPDDTGWHILAEALEDKSPFRRPVTESSSVTPTLYVSVCVGGRYYNLPHYRPGILCDQHYAYATSRHVVQRRFINPEFLPPREQMPGEGSFTSTVYPDKVCIQHTGGISLLIARGTRKLDANDDFLGMPGVQSLGIYDETDNLLCVCLHHEVASMPLKKSDDKLSYVCTACGSMTLDPLDILPECGIARGKL